jgi:NAD(P)-dependent dehydrogenase (short-subunit alcohol dehydrogenase family)
MTIAKKAEQLLSLEGQVAMVTGAASGIGRGIALLLAQMGAAVAVLDIDDQSGAEAVSGICGQSGKAIFLRCDVSSAEDCARAARTTLETFGKINILCNNAGIVIRKSVAELREEEWDLVLDVTLKSVYLTLPRSNSSHDPQWWRPDRQHRLGMVTERRTEGRCLLRR